ncbi:MAG: phosphatase PAP2 family protein [Candidatus Kryptoniota bacterium]
MTDWISSIDIQLLLFVNSHHSLLLDKIMWFSSEKWGWLPLYAFLIGAVIWKLKWRSLPFILILALTITLTDQLSSHVIKPLVHRPRPTHIPQLIGQIRVLHNYVGGLYGFVSSHAANTFGATFFFLFVLGERLKWIPYLMFIWASVVSYSRIYLGVHFPTDVLGGIVVGLIVAAVTARIQLLVEAKFYEKR